MRALLSTARAGVGPGVPLLHAVDDDLAIFGREPLEESRHSHGADDDADDEDAVPSGYSAPSRIFSEREGFAR